MGGGESDGSTAHTARLQRCRRRARASSLPPTALLPLFVYSFFSELRVCFLVLISFEMVG